MYEGEIQRQTDWQTTAALISLKDKMISREKNRGRQEAEVSGENEMPTGQQWNASGWEPQAQSSLKTNGLF